MHSSFQPRYRVLVYYNILKWRLWRRPSVGTRRIAAACAINRILQLSPASLDDDSCLASVLPELSASDDEFMPNRTVMP